MALKNSINDHVVADTFNTKLGVLLELEHIKNQDYHVMVYQS